MIRAMVLFCSFVLLFNFALPKPSTAETVQSEQKPILTFFLDLFNYTEWKMLGQSVENQLHSFALLQNELSETTILKEAETNFANLLPEDNDFISIHEYSNVHDNLIWRIEFNEEIAPNSLTNETLFILNREGERVPTLIINDSERIINILPPVEKYEVGETYFLYVTNRIEGAKGQKMNEQFLLTFTIQERDLLPEQPASSGTLKFSFAEGYEGVSMEANQAFEYDNDFLKQINNESNDGTSNNEFFIKLMKKFDEIKEQSL